MRQPFEHVYVDAVASLLWSILESCKRLKLLTTTQWLSNNTSPDVL